MSSPPPGPHAALIEGVITESEDDGLLDRYLGGEEVGFRRASSTIWKRPLPGVSFHPVLAAVPTTGLGVAELLE